MLFLVNETLTILSFLFLSHNNIPELSTQQKQQKIEEY